MRMRKVFIITCTVLYKIRTRHCTVASISVGIVIRTLRSVFYLNINQRDALNFMTNLLHASTCFEHTCLSSACKMNTTQNQPHQISNTQRTENKTTAVVIQHSRRLLKIDILMSETC